MFWDLSISAVKNRTLYYLYQLHKKALVLQYCHCGSKTLTRNGPWSYFRWFMQKIIYIPPKNKQFANEKWCLEDSFLFDIVPFQANMLLLLGGKMFDFCHMEKLTKYLSDIKKDVYPRKQMAGTWKIVVCRRFTFCKGASFRWTMFLGRGRERLIIH